MRFAIVLLAVLMQVSGQCNAEQPSQPPEQQGAKAVVHADEAKWALLKVGLTTAEVRTLLGSPVDFVGTNTGRADGTRKFETVFTYVYEAGADVRQLKFEGVGATIALVSWTGASKVAN